jgi:hypothetical protein
MFSSAYTPSSVFFGAVNPSISAQGPGTPFVTTVAAAGDTFTLSIADPASKLVGTTYTVTMTGVTMGAATLGKTISVRTTTGEELLDHRSHVMRAAARGRSARPSSSSTR